MHALHTCAHTLTHIQQTLTQNKQHAYLQAQQDIDVFPLLPLLRGKRFELLGPGELADTLAICTYCGEKIPDTMITHVMSHHQQEHYE